MKNTSILLSPLGFLKVPFELKNRHVSIAILSFVLFVATTVVGISEQLKIGILFDFSFSNYTIFTLSVMYVIIVSQYFFLRDDAFFYYALYLFINLFYFHHVVFFGEHEIQIKSPFPLNFLFEVSLFLTYFLYGKFMMSFLNLRYTNTILEKRIAVCVNLYLIIVGIDFVLAFFSSNRLTNVVFITLLVLCIGIGFFAISSVIFSLKTRLARIFIAGTLFFYIGSILGFLFTMNFLTNPFQNVLMKHWTFFTELGVLIEIIFFSTGLSYRMRLIEVEKNNIEKELFREKLKELDYKTTLLRQRESISHDLHDDVGATLNSISVFSEIARQQIQKTSPEATKTLNRIGEASAYLIETINDIVWAVHPKNDNFENITLRMRLFSADLLMRSDVKTHFTSDESLNPLNLNIEVRKQFYLIFKEAINNVYKHAHCDELKIQILKLGGGISMSIEDNGVGFNIDDPQAGNGLISMHDRAKKLKGILKVDSYVKKGTRVELFFLVDDLSEEKLPQSVVT